MAPLLLGGAPWTARRQALSKVADGMYQLGKQHNIQRATYRVLGTVRAMCGEYRFWKGFINMRGQEAGNVISYFLSLLVFRATRV